MKSLWYSAKNEFFLPWCFALISKKLERMSTCFLAHLLSTTLEISSRLVVPQILLTKKRSCCLMKYCIWIGDMFVLWNTLLSMVIKCFAAKFFFHRYWTLLKKTIVKNYSLVKFPLKLSFIIQNFALIQLLIELCTRICQQLSFLKVICK